jgi:methionine-rich copper-binding protein CopC
LRERSRIGRNDLSPADTDHVQRSGDPAFLRPGVEGSSRKLIATGKAAVDPANRNVLVVPIGEPLPPGNYEVDWHAVAEDTHRVKGNYSFRVGR